MPSPYARGKTLRTPGPVPTGDARSLINELAPRYRIDPRAAVAVALGEGGLVNRKNDVGDLAGGGSYGPFQLYAQGALPAQYRGNPQAADAYAWSREGIEYALRKMAESGAAGLTGEQAVETIIRKFERPAKPDASVAAALGRLGSVPQAARGGSGAETVTLPPGPPGFGGSGGASPLLGSLPLASVFARNAQALGAPASLSALTALAGPQAPAPAPFTPAAPSGLTAPPRGVVAAVPQKAPKTENRGRWLELFGKPFGVTVTSSTGGNHVVGSYHFQDAEHGGRARDFGGTPAQMAALYNAALRQPSAFREAFYTGPGAAPYYIKNGRVYPIAQLDRSVYASHKTHVHLAR